MPDKPREFQRIEDFFAPLARRAEGAFGLQDDAAILTPPEGRDLVVTTDTLVAMVHFLEDDDPADLATKLLRVSLSDLAAMGAEPFAYTLNLALPPEIDDPWLGAFTAGVAQDQERYGIDLVGGDTVSTPGMLTVGATLFGTVPSGLALRRRGAAQGDLIMVSGTIGDGALGLLAARNRLSGIRAEVAQELAQRYRRPEPRVVLGQGLIGLASAAIDVSDGLAGDLAHMAAASGVRIVLEAPSVPLSAAAAEVLHADPSRRLHVLTGGDDYELAFAVPPARRSQVETIARSDGVNVTAVGWVEQGSGLIVQDSQGRPMELPTLGYSHG